MNLSDGCQNLESIDISHCKNLTTDGIRMLTKRCPKLKHFSSKYLIALNDIAIKELANNCTNLMHASLQNCLVRLMKLDFIILIN